MMTQNKTILTIYPGIEELPVKALGIEHDILQ